jgi:hypothetical protein
MKELQSLCQGQRNLYVHEIKTSSCERDVRWEKKMGEKRKKKVCWSCERDRETKLMRELVNEYYSSKFQKNLVKVVRLLEIIF